MKYSMLLATALMLSLNPASGAEPQDPLQGTWSIVQMERGGRQPPQELIKSSKIKMVIKGNTLRISDNNRGEGATFTLDNSKKPHTIDLVFKEGPNEDVERKALGIYEIDGANLKFAWHKDGGPRPTKFKSIKGDRTSELWVLKRRKKE